MCITIALLRSPTQAASSSYYSGRCRCRCWCRRRFVPVPVVVVVVLLVLVGGGVAFVVVVEIVDQCATKSPANHHDTRGVGLPRVTGEGTKILGCQLRCPVLRGLRAAT